MHLMHTIWILGHIIMVRQALLTKLGGQPLLSAESTTAYGRGSQPADGLPERLPDLAAAYERSQEQMEALLGFALPAPARTERDWWTGADVPTHRHSAAWMGAGRTAIPNFSARTVTFERLPDLHYAANQPAER